MSINFNTGYMPPGVYVQPVSTPTPTVAAIAGDVIAVVGPAQGWLTNTESGLFSTSTAAALSKQGINTSSIVITDSSGNVQASSSYTVTQTGTAPATTTTIQLTQNSAMNSNTVYYVTYSYTDQNYYTPQVFTDQQTLFNTFGTPFTAAGGINSPLSLAGMLVLLRASVVVIMPTTDTGNVATRTGLAGAYSALEAVDGIDIIVPLPVGINGTAAVPGDVPGVASDIASHCTLMSEPTVGYMRTAILGFESTVTVAPDTIAASTASSRVLMPWPFAYGYYNGQAQQTLTVGSYYLAAQMAAMLASQPKSYGLTRKIVSGFVGIPNNILTTMTVPYKNQLSAAGVAVIEPASGSGGALWCRHGTTTLTTNPMTRELSLVRCSDAIYEEIVLSYNQTGIIGDPITSNTMDVINSTATGALEALLSAQVIQGYTSPTATQDPVNPDVVNLTFGYSPSYPLNYLNVMYSVNNTTGTITPATSASTSGATSVYSGSSISSS